MTFPYCSTSIRSSSRRSSCSRRAAYGATLQSGLRSPGSARAIPVKSVVSPAPGFSRPTTSSSASGISGNRWRQRSSTTQSAFSATASSTADRPVARMTSTFAPAGSTSVHPGSSSTPSTRPGPANAVSRRCRKRRTSASYTETSSCSSGDACRPKSPSSTGPRREALRGRHRRPSDWSQRSSVALDRELWGETATLTRPRRSPCARRHRGCRAAVARGRRTPVPAPGPPRSGSSRVPPRAHSSRGGLR